MSITITCPADGQPWAVVPGILKAHPGRQSEVTMATVPNEDIYGSRLGGTHQVPSSRWLSDGPSASLTTMTSQDGLETIYVWSCLCGKGLEYRVPAMELVDCAPGGTTCSKRANQINPPADLYVNPRHGGACPCCGHQGTHWVRKDRQGHLPACMTGWDGSWATRPGPR